jgi:hypothetical protein
MFWLVFVALLRQQLVALFVTALLLATRFLALGIGVHRHDIRLGLLLFGLGSLAVSLFSDLYILRLLGVAITKVALRTILCMGITLVLLKLVSLSIEAGLS